MYAVLSAQFLLSFISTNNTTKIHNLQHKSVRGKDFRMLILEYSFFLIEKLKNVKSFFSGEKNIIKRKSSFTI